MVNYAQPSYPEGVMLDVVRHAAARNWEGDRPGGTTEHQIGPCDVKWLTDTEDTSKGEVLTLKAQITAPGGSDVLAKDEIRYPGIDGLFAIDGQVRDVPEAFTGWSAGTRFRIAKDGPRGV